LGLGIESFNSVYCCISSSREPLQVRCEKANMGNEPAALRIEKLAKHEVVGYKSIYKLFVGLPDESASANQSDIKFIYRDFTRLLGLSEEKQPKPTTAMPRLIETHLLSYIA
jgi:hypothetical protein